MYIFQRMTDYVKKVKDSFIEKVIDHGEVSMPIHRDPPKRPFDYDDESDQIDETLHEITDVILTGGKLAKKILKEISRRKK